MGTSVSTTVLDISTNSLYFLLGAFSFFPMERAFKGNEWLCKFLEQVCKLPCGRIELKILNWMLDEEKGTIELNWLLSGGES